MPVEDGRAVLCRLAATLALAACGHGAHPGPVPDASVAADALDEEGLDVEVGDGGTEAGPAPRDAASEADRSCPILSMSGNDPPNPCTQCASAVCCPTVTACFSGGVDAASYSTASGGYSDCYSLFLCNTGCFELVPDMRWACIHACEEQYPGAIVAFTNVITCFDSPAYCGTDAGQCQIANPDGGPGTWPYPGS